MTETPVSVVTDGLAGLQDNILSIAGVALPIGATLLALTVGWRVAKRFVRG